MRSLDFPAGRRTGFTLVEMLVVIAIMSILMTAGAIGLGNLGGKGTTSAVASAESIFDEARGTAVGERTKARVLVAKNLTNNSADNLRRIMVAKQTLNEDGTPKDWELSSRGVVLPDGVFFSQELSSKSVTGGGEIDTETFSSFRPAYRGEYYVYEFNAEGICTTPGATFVVGSGTRPVNNPTAKPRLTAAGQNDFGGFVVWRSGRTSLFRTPEQISEQVKNMKAGSEF